jgi:hypothetical protein
MYEPRQFEMIEMRNSIYFGEPSDRLENAWNDLLQCK